jgi:UDP-2-acetamido-3-amino-2,3-dideoxy-glucuronate N-acetyltransferase
MADNTNIHPLADVQCKSIGEGTQIWQFAIVLPGANIGRHCNINCHTFIENDVVIGDYVTVKSGVYIWDGIRVEDHVFIGPNVTFTNDHFPRSRQRPEQFRGACLKNNASIGANATILGSVTIGSYALVGAGSVVTRDVPDHALVYGNPARQHGWVDENGIPLRQIDKAKWQSESGKEYRVADGKLNY